MAHPTENLVRAMPSTVDEGRTLYGHFSVFGEWYEIDSTYEGRFLEQVAPGAFQRAFATQGDRLRVLFNHGTDPTVGFKPLGEIRSLAEDAKGARYEVDLFDVGYVNDLLPALRANQFGSSFKFRVAGEEWSNPQRATDRNPERLPERTITDVDLWEFGPVVWGANPAATAAVRSLTDNYIDALISDPLFVARLTERAGSKVVERILSELPPDGRRSSSTPEAMADGQATGLNPLRLRNLRQRAQLLKETKP